MTADELVGRARAAIADECPIAGTYITDAALAAAVRVVVEACAEELTFRSCMCAKQIRALAPVEPR